MTKAKSRANGDGDVFPRKNKAGQITGYRGAYFGRMVRGPTSLGRSRKRLVRCSENPAPTRMPGLRRRRYPDSRKLFLNRWLSDSARDTVWQRTYERYESIVRVHIKPNLGRLKLKALTPAHARALYRQKSDSGLSPRTVTIHPYIHVTLHKALSQAVSD